MNGSAGVFAAPSHGSLWRRSVRGKRSGGVKKRDVGDAGSAGYDATIAGIPFYPDYLRRNHGEYAIF